MDISKIKNDLISEIRLSEIQAKIFLLLVIEGKTNAQKIGQKFDISIDESRNICKQLEEFGSIIEITEDVFEAMHPRFTAVNMYRKMCEREKIEFRRNKIVDNIGVALEKSYEDARTK